MRKPYTNDSEAPIYVGGVLILAGETRVVDVHEPTEAVAEKPEDPQAALKALVAGKAPDLIAALPGIGDADLTALLELEQAKSNPRSTVVAAIEAAKLDRQKLVEEAAKRLADAITSLPEKTDEELAELLEAAKALPSIDTSITDAIELEQLAREDAKQQAAQQQAEETSQQGGDQA